MTVRTAFESAPEAAGDAVVHAVAAARRRLRAVRMLRAAAVTAPGGVAVGGALALAAGTPLWASAALGVLGAAGGMVWAAAQTPPPPAVARLLDAHLGLRDRVTAALQLRETGGPIAALVARDAAARVAPVDLRALFPLALGRAPLVTAAVAAALTAWLAAAGDDGRRAPSPATGAAQSGDAAARGGPARRASTTEAARQVTGERSERTAERLPELQRPRTGADAAPRDPASAPSPGTQPAGPTTAAGAPGRPPSTGAGAQPNATASVAPGNAAAAGRGGSGAGGTARGAESKGAGGVAGGAAVAAATGLVPVTSAAARNAARASAEAALARDVVPPDHREHVRAYFRALASDASVARGSR